MVDGVQSVKGIHMTQYLAGAMFKLRQKRSPLREMSQQAQRCSQKGQGNTEAADKKAKEAQTNAAKKAKEAAKKEKEKRKRERRKLNKLKRAEEGKKLEIASNSSNSSSSEPDSPRMTISDARANRAGLFAKKVYTPNTAYAYPTLGAVHEEVELMSEEQLAQEIQKCRLARTNASPIIKGMI